VVFIPSIHQKPDRDQAIPHLLPSCLEQLTHHTNRFPGLGPHNHAAKGFYLVAFIFLDWGSPFCPGSKTNG
jgi:hypothetical protein